MEENLKSKLGFFLFFFFVLFLAFGGYCYLKYMKYEEKNKNKNEEVVTVNHKIDDDKDFIYFVNEETISEKGELYYKDIIINLDTQTTLSEALGKENQIYKINIKYISEMEIMNNSLITYNYDNIYSLTFRKYDTYEFGKYISLLVRDYDYSCFDGVTFNDSKSFVFNTENGELIQENELLNMYNLNIDSVKEKVNIYLNAKQSKVNGVDVIKIDETIDGLNANSLYINEYGHLTISYLVKTSQIDYNEITEVS